ncbi:hypothetical protein K1719_039849 [Acacia pycnantha]|nr:hypothetical protein K1719_039849 [Acacia pycnantha]
MIARIEIIEMQNSFDAQLKEHSNAATQLQDLLREQNKELATFRMERDHSEVERAQHLQQIHELQEHIQGKERQLMELQEQGLDDLLAGASEFENNAYALAIVPAGKLFCLLQ